MKLARVGIIATAVLAVATMAFAQKPDFSGTWTLDEAATGAPAGGGGGGGGGRGGGGGLGMGATVKQTADTLTYDRTFGDNKITSTYKLDGTESKNTMMGRGGAAGGVGLDRQVGRRQADDHDQGRRKREHPGLVARRQRPHHRDDKRPRHAEEGL